MSIKLSLLRLTTFVLLASVASPSHAFSLMPSEIPPTEFSAWQTMIGDAMIVDTEANIGYLIHRDGGFTSFPVATGQRRVVRYIGRTYNASTPNRAWNVIDTEVKGDRVTFGPQGLFMRLANDGERTPYGIHSHRSITMMLAEQGRYRSMGCILVSQEVLDVIEATFEDNGRQLNVLTIAGLGDAPVTYRTLMEKVAAK